MVSKPKPSSKKKAPQKKPNMIQPENWTGYPIQKQGNCPMETLRRTAGGGRRASQR